MMREIAIVGGSGFIGTHLAGLLSRRHMSFRILDILPSAAFPECYRFLDVRDESACRRELSGCDVVINLAAVHRDDEQPRSRYYETNVDGARALCLALSALEMNRLLFTSSVAVYGNVRGEGDESAPLNPVNDYGISKAQAEKVYREWAAGGSRSLVIVRPAVVFGPGNHGNVANLIAQIAADRFVMVGSGQNRKSMAAVENLCEFIAAAIPHASGTAVYNYCDKPDFTMEALVRLVRETLGKSSGRLRLPYWLGVTGGAAFDIMGSIRGRPFAISSQRVRKFCATTSFITSRPAPAGFRPVVSLEEAMREFILHEHGARCSSAGDR